MPALNDYTEIRLHRYTGFDCGIQCTHLALRARRLSIISVYPAFSCSYCFLAPLLLFATSNLGCFKRDLDLLLSYCLLSGCKLRLAPQAALL